MGRSKMHLKNESPTVGFKFKQTWFLYLALVLFVVCGWLLVENWSPLMSAIVDMQQQFHEMLSAHINAISKSRDTFGWSLIGLSFLYGVFHAAGPGHGKVIITTYVTTQGETLKHSVWISFLSALVQSLTAIAIVWGLVSLFSIRLSDTRAFGMTVETASYLLVMLFGLVLVTTSAYRIFKQRSDVHNHDHHAHDHSHDGVHSHDHDDHSHCNHVHVPQAKYNVWQALGVILSVGIRPCSGALVVLIYAKVVGVFYYGIAATLAIGFGTGITVAAIAVISVLARDSLTRLVQAESSISWDWHKLSLYVKAVGGALLVMFGWSLYSAASAIATSHPLL